MKAKLASTLQLVGIIFIIPLLPHRELLGTWPVLLAALSGIFLNISQPRVTAENLKAKSTPDRRSVLFLMVAGCLIFLIPVLDYAYGRQTRPSLLSEWSLIGLFLIVFGLGFRYWSIRTLGKFFTSVVMVQSDQRVIDHGPYRYIRHPSYTGAFVMAVGVSLIFRSYVGLAFCFLGFFPVYIYRIAVEETVLTSALGDAYKTYKNRTWRLVPFIY